MKSCKRVILHKLLRAGMKLKPSASDVAAEAREKFAADLAKQAKKGS